MSALALSRPMRSKTGARKGESTPASKAKPGSRHSSRDHSLCSCSIEAASTDQLPGVGLPAYKDCKACTLRVSALRMSLTASAVSRSSRSCTWLIS